MVAMTITATTPSRPLDMEIAGIHVMGTRRTFWFSKLFARTDRVTIGRTRQRDIRIDDDSISRLHCTLEKVQIGDTVRYQLVDCDSYNGLRIRRHGRYSPSKAVDEAELTIFSRVRLGRIKLVPVTAASQCLMLVKTESGLMREAYDVYGAYKTAARFTGLSAVRLWNFFRKKRNR